MSGVRAAKDWTPWLTSYDVSKNHVRENRAMCKSNIVILSVIGEEYTWKTLKPCGYSV